MNEPVYFHEFVAHAAGSRAAIPRPRRDFSEMQTACCPSVAVEELALAGKDVLKREQYLDFVNGRMFRQTLLCRAELEIDRSPQPLIVEPLTISFPRRRPAFPIGRAGSPSRAHGLHADDRSPTGHSGPGACGQQLARCHLGARPDPRERERGGPPGGLRRGPALLRGEPCSVARAPPPLTTSVSERPEASPLARHQARSGQLVTNLRHASVRLEDDLGRRLVVLLDGTRDHVQLLDELRAFLLETGHEVPEPLETGPRAQPRWDRPACAVACVADLECLAQALVLSSSCSSS